MNVFIATVHLNRYQPFLRKLYDRVAKEWGAGEQTLFHMASRISYTKHPVPMLASMGWKIPSSGDCSLYTTLCSVTVIEEFCSVLLSARFDLADTLLDLIGRMHLDAYINDIHVRNRNNLSNQGDSETCYAHATAAVIHMALLRIVRRKGGCPSIKKIRKRILKSFPPAPGVSDIQKFLKAVVA